VSRDRREWARHSFSATAEVEDLRSGARLTARAADLSRKGCYLDSLNPFVVGTSLRLRVVWQGSELNCAATVRDSKPGMGMGVAFTDLDATQIGLVENWIQKLTSPPTAQASVLATSRDTSLPHDEERILRLVQLLEKKGILSADEVAALLERRT